jgi:hypothetical protein
MKASSSTEMLIHVYQNTRYNTEDNNRYVTCPFGPFLAKGWTEKINTVA